MLTIDSMPVFINPEVQKQLKEHYKKMGIRRGEQRQVKCTKCKAMFDVDSTAVVYRYDKQFRYCMKCYRG